jgi:hypothetical protein
MTERIGGLAIDGTPISASDMARLQAEDELRAEWQRKAVRVVAASALGAEDCRLLLSILGLDVQVIADARRAAARPVVRKPAGKPPRKATRKRRVRAA